MTRLLNRLIVLSLLACPAMAGPGMTRINPSETGFPYSGGTLFGPIAFCVLTQVADDATPEVGTLGGCVAGTGGNIVKTSTTHSGPISITDFDGALVGQVLIIHGGGGANATTIANAGNFTLEMDWVDTADRELVLWTVATSTFVEVTRHNGPRTYDGAVEIDDTLFIDGDADTIQLTVQAHSSQTITNPLIQIQKSDGTPILEINSNAVSNFFAGVDSGDAITSGVYSTFAGQNSGTGVVDTNYNTAYGFDSLRAAAGAINTAIGAHSLDTTVGGRGNTGIGGRSGQYNTSGDYNTFTGNQAGYYTETGDYNVCVGKGSGEGVSGNSYDNNTLVGALSGTALTIGSYNSLYGYSSGDNLTTGSYNIIFGYDLDASAPGVDYELNIGDLIKGDLNGNDGVNITATTITESGNTDTTLLIEHTLNDTGAPDATEDYTAIKLDVTETDKTGWTTVNLMDLQVSTASKFKIDDTGATVATGGMSLGGGLDMNSNDITELGTLHGSNSETLENLTDGSWRMTSVGGTNNEDLEIDLDATADLVTLRSSTGVTTWDWEAIGLACGAADLSEGNITNVGDVQLDSLTADAIGVSLAGVAITESAATDTTLSITHTLNDTGAPDATEDFTAIKLDVTETDKTGWATVNLMDLQVDTVSKFLVDDTGAMTMSGGMSLGGDLDMNSHAVTEVTSLGGSNAETLDNLTDGSWVMTGVGGANNEDLEIDLEATADTITIGSSTGVATWDWVAIGLAAGSADLSDGNLTNIGDVQADSITADGTALQTNATTTIIQQNADLASGNAISLDSHADAELTAASGTQSFVRIAPEILQTSTANYTALEIDVTESSEGSTTDYLMSLEVADAAKYSVDSDGNTVNVGTLSVTGAVDFTADLTMTSGGTIATTANGDLDLAPNGNGIIDAIAEVYQGDGTYSWDHTPTLATEGIFEADGEGYFDAGLTVASTLAVDAITPEADNGIGITGTAITESGTTDTALYIEHTLNDTGAPDATEDYTAIKLDVTETDKTGWSTVNLLDLKVGGTSKFRVNDAGAINLGTNVSDIRLSESSTSRLYIQNGDGTLWGKVYAGDTYFQRGSFAGLALTESGATDTTMSITGVLNDAGAPDATEDYTALKVNITETDKTGWVTVNLMDLQVDTVSKFKIDNTGAVTYAGGMSLGGGLDMNSNDITELGTLHGSNSETLENLTDGSWRITSVGGSNNEDAEFDLDATADLVTVRSSTGVTTWDWEAIGLACGTVDLSDGNLTNAGDLQADSITADGTTLQTNATTTVLQQNADLASGNAFTLNSHADAELTAASGAQSFVRIAPEILQTSTAGYIALEIDVTESSEGSVTDYLMSLEIADSPKLTVDSDGNTVNVGTLMVNGVVTIDDTGTGVNSPVLSLKGDSGGTEVEGQIQLIFGADPYVRISVDDDDSTPAMTGVIDIHDSALSFVNDDTTDIGAAGANRPKDLYLSGDATLANLDSSGSNGALTSLIQPDGESLTCVGGASLTTSGLIPRGSILLGITTRITTALTGSTGFTVGDGADVDIYGIQAAATQGVTTGNTPTAVWGNPVLSASEEVTITFAGGVCTDGVVLVVPHYITVTAPTSN
jgi:hypothetical protein